MFYILILMINVFLHNIDFILYSPKTSFFDFSNRSSNCFFFFNFSFFFSIFRYLILSIGFGASGLITSTVKSDLWWVASIVANWGSIYIYLICARSSPAAPGPLLPPISNALILGSFSPYFESKIDPEPACTAGDWEV